jgi:5-formyltetrahydrofolate cyclo-ligase
VAAPRVDWENRRLLPCLIQSLTCGIEIGPRNVPQPSADAPLCPLEDIDLILTPGLAFDPSGYRLGRGAGFYDRFLAKHSSRAHAAGHTQSARPPAAGTRSVCGVAFEEQIVDAVPRDAWDHPLELIVTDRRVLRPRA